MTRDELFRTLKRAVTGSFEVLAELGRGPGGRNAFVAREVEGGGLVVLELNLESSDAAGTPSYGLYVRRELDASVPALSLQCNQCGASITGWARFCPQCDSDLSGVAHTTGGRRAADLMRTGQLAGQDRYELLGAMPRAEGGGAVYFARERASGRLVTLRVEKVEGAGEGEYTLDATQSMPALSHGGAAPTPAATARIQWRGHETRAGGAAESTGAGAPGAGPPSRGPTAAAAGGRTPAPEPLAAPGYAPAGLGGAGAPEHPWYCPTCGASYPAGVWFCPRDGTAVKPAETTDKLLGQTIAGRYRVLRKVGAGGMGTVYLAEHVRIGRPCALKIMNPALKGDSEALSRFGREAAQASRITHPNVAAIYDFGEAEDGTVYLAMEYAEGESLAALIKRTGPVPAERAGALMGQVLDALAAAHALGIVHRDLKPDNIILTTTHTGGEAVKVIDFGIAKTIRAVESQQLTRSGFVVGTPKYMSPEQIAGDTLDGRTDIYSAACILYELLVGAAPFSGPSGEITITRRLSEPPPHPRQQNRNVPRPLDQVVVRAMARRVDDRYRTAEEFRDALALAMRSSITGSWSKRWADTARGSAAVGRGAIQVLRRLGQGTAPALAALGRQSAAAGAGTMRGGAVVARALGRRLRPLLSWRWAGVAAAVLVVAIAGPSTVRWLARPRPAPAPARVAAGPAAPAPEAAATTPSAATTSPAEPVTATPARPPAAQAADAGTGAQTVRPASALPAERPGAQRPAASAPVTLAAPPRTERVAAAPQAAPGRTRGDQPPTGPITTPTIRRPQTEAAPPTATPATSPDAARAARAAPPPATPAAEASKPAPVREPAATAGPAVDSLRAKLRLVGLFAGREEYPDAFAVLAVVRGRLDALRRVFPSDGSVRAVRAEYTQALSSATSRCEAARRVAADRGESAPACR